MRRSFPYLILLITFCAAYLIRYEMVRPSFEVGQTVRVIGQISEEPSVYDLQQKIQIGTIAVYVNRYPEYLYGDFLQVEGIVARGKSGYFLKNPKLEVVTETGNIFQSLRERVVTLYRSYLPEPQSSLLAGIVLGTKSSLGSDFFESLRATGTLHVIAASGMNITLFAGTLLSLLAFLIGRRRAIGPALVAVWVYVLLVGWQPPIVRAGVMGSIAFLAQALGREFDGLRALAISGALLLFVNPLWLFDIGFQLSFLATFGMVVLGSRIREAVEKVRFVPRVVRADLAATLAAQIAVSPLLALRFGQVSLISPVVNTFILWTVPFIMAGGLICALLGLVFAPFGQVAAWILWVPLTYFIKVIEAFSNIQISNF